ncbi:flagellin/flagellar hook associated protein [Agrobacterium rubi]|nr:flagellin/flagellar hook associated protein [Agrobacterium rubi]NTF24105.1 flagellin/flagellar hook associated protein [Agrobacterium rubi]
MTSILTNHSAMTALQTLRAVGQALSEQQTQVSSGMRVAYASDNAAYWSISTTMRSDSQAISAVSDALGLGQAKVDVAYSGMDAVVGTLSEFKARLVAAKEPGVDIAKVQQDLDQFKQQVVSISTSASFSGQNWLSTDIPDLYDTSLNKASVVSSFTRGSGGGVAVNHIDVPLLGISLFNSAGGGLLQADPRDIKTIGGLRFPYDGGSMSDYSLRSTGGYRPSDFRFDFSAPMTFDAGDSISFEVVVDADNPADGITAPYRSGKTSAVTIDAGVVNSVLGRTDGTISTYKDYARVLRSVLSGSGLTATTYTRWEPPGQTKTWVDIPDVVGIMHNGVAGLDGSAMEVRNVSANGVAVTGEIEDRAVSYGGRRSSMTLDFKPFTVFEGVVVSMNFRIDDEGYKSLSFDKDFVESVLGVDDGRVETAEDMASVLSALVARPDVIVEATDASTVSVRTDPLIDRKSGHRSSIGFYGISVNIEPIPTMNFMDIDIEQNPGMVDSYLTYMDTVFGRVVDATSSLGALQSRMEMQAEFAGRMLDAMKSGIGRLVDADMNEASARLRALQAQQQLAIESLQIANAQSDSLLSLFR